MSNISNIQLKKDLYGKCSYNDVPKFPHINYSVNMSWRYFITWLEESKIRDNLQLQPDFQRGHVWTLDQKIKFVEFSLRGGTSAKNIYFNHPSWMDDFNEHEGYKDFVCVDGLQRISSVLEFMDNKIPVFGGIYLSDFDKIPLHSLEFVVNIAKLQTELEVLTWYFDFNSGGTVHTEEELKKVQKKIKLLLKNKKS